MKSTRISSFAIVFALSEILSYRPAAVGLRPRRGYQALSCKVSLGVEPRRLRILRSIVGITDDPFKKG